MKQNWWKLIVVAALVAAVAVVVAARNNAPVARTSVAKDSGLTAPVDRRADEGVGTSTEQAPPKSAAPTDAAGPDSIAAPKVYKHGTPATASVKSPVPKPADKASKTAFVEKPKPQAVAKPQQAKKQLPKLVDLGATKCIPCRMMAPILDELKKEYKGRLRVVFIDVWENRGEAEKYGIQSIPTQIFYDEKGKEFFRHEGFFPKEDILKTFEDNGITL